MTKSTIGIAALAALIGTPALAADMALKAPPSAPLPMANWAGCYGGLNAGALVGADHYDLSMAGAFLLPNNIFSDPANSGQLNHSYSTNPVGFSGGGQIGCNQQSGTWVYGLEADIDGATRLDTNASYGPLASLPVPAHTETITTELGWYTTLRARLGYTITPAWLLYATGGLAVGGIQSTTNVQFGTGGFFLSGYGFMASQTTTRAGWTVGAGTEWALGNRWSIKAEYLFLDFGSFTYLSPCSAGPCVGFVPAFDWQTHVRADESVFRLGVNYRFGGRPL